MLMVSKESASGGGGGKFSGEMVFLSGMQFFESYFCNSPKRYQLLVRRRESIDSRARLRKWALIVPFERNPSMLPPDDGGF